MINFKLGAIAAAFGFALSLLVGLFTGAGLVAVVRALVFAAFFFVLACVLHIAAGRFLPELLEISASGDAPDEPGSRVNITLEGRDDPGAFGMASPPLPGDTGFDPDAPIPSAALDQLNEDGYTKEGGELSFPSGAAPFDGGGEAAPVIPGGGGAFEGAALAPQGGGLPPGEAAASAALPEKEGNLDSVDVLPDLEAMSNAFLASTQEAEQGGDGGGDPEGGGGNPFESGGFQDTTESIFEVSVSGQSREPAPYVGNKPVVLEGDYQPKDIAQAIQTILKRE